MNPYIWPMWLKRATRIGVELEIEDITKPGDKYQVLRNTGRSRWIVWGLPLPWVNHRVGRPA